MRLLNAFERAAVNLSWKGSQHPDDWEKIEIKYAKARSAMVNLLFKLEHK